jgi:hypothetical protein
MNEKKIVVMHMKIIGCFEKIILSFISFMKRLDIDRSGLVLSKFFILMVQ